LDKFFFDQPNRQRCHRDVLFTFIKASLQNCS
jgi:hypothetical protein